MFEVKSIRYLKTFESFRLVLEKTYNSGLGIWKDSDGKPIYDKAERLKMGMQNNDKCEIKELIYRNIKK